MRGAMPLPSCASVKTADAAATSVICRSLRRDADSAEIFRYAL